LLKLMSHWASIRSVLSTALLLSVFARPALGTDYKGRMDFECCDTAFYLRVRGHSKGSNASKQEVVLRLHHGCPNSLPLEAFVAVDRVVSAKLCGAESKQCETATAAKIYLDSVSKNGMHASGKFSADFPTGGHQEGKFTVKDHHEGPIPICE